ncbi:MAG: NAD(P)H-binding protein [Anaerolineales bacterium]|nr:NAD(P)H-binding protein [Anaerolineales bacterium]
MKPIHAVTGVAGYTGKYITRRLLGAGIEVIGLTNHPARPSEFGERVRFYPFDFDQPERLAAHLEGVEVLYNTYWVRFDHGRSTYESAVRNTRVLIDAARRAGVRRLVHVSITNPSLDSPLPYFQGKALLEEAIRASGLSYAILRPTVLFGLEDILINNIAYLLRKFPLFAIPGDGTYRLQPVFVDDLAALAVRAAGESENYTLDAVGPDVFSYNALVRLIGDRIGRRPPILHFEPELALSLAGLLGRFYGDVLITREEYLGLSADLLVSSQPPTCPTPLGEWLAQNAPALGQRYASEIARHYQP